MLRKKIANILATIMIVTTIFGNQGMVVNASTLNDIDTVTKASTSVPEVTPEVTVKDGEYIVNNQVEYIPVDENSNVETGNSMARNALSETTQLAVKDGQVQMSLSFKSSLFMFMEDIRVSLDGEDLNGQLDKTNKLITFNVPSVDSKIRVDMNITVMGKAVSFYVTNDTADLPMVDNNESEDGNVEVPVVLKDGKYKATNITRYILDSEHGNSSARKALETETLIDVANGEVKQTLTFTSMFSMVENITVSIDGQEVATDINNETREMTFTIPYVDKEVLVGMNIKGMDHQVEFYVKSDMDTLETIKDTSGESGSTDGDNNGGTVNPDEGNGGTSGGNEGNTGGNQDGSGNEEGAEDVVGKKVYTGKNKVTHENDTGLEMARKALSEDLIVEEVDGKYCITLTFTDMGSTMMKNHVITVNGKSVNATKAMNNNKISLKFEVKSLSDDINVSAYVDMMEKNVDFGVKVLEDTLVLVTEATDDSNDEILGDITGEGTTEGNTSGSNQNATTEEETKVTVGKLYSIQNNVIHESETGVAMARKYLNAISKVEEIEGQYYVTLTFTGANFMQNHVIYVNGRAVSVIRTTNGDETNIRFAVDSLTDDITVKVYVVPMSREVEFGVVLLADTLTFIKEYTVETLPNTGATTSSAAVAGLGLILTSAGAVLSKKRK